MGTGVDAPADDVIQVPARQGNGADRLAGTGRCEAHWEARGMMEKAPSFGRESHQGKKRIDAGDHPG